MYRIKKQFHFCASHQIKGLSTSHPCSRLHGHNYILEVELEGADLNEVGFIRDYRELDDLKIFLDSKVDHRHLNDALGNTVTTSEQLAKFFFDWCIMKWPETYAVRISETPKTWAEYRANRDA